MLNNWKQLADLVTQDAVAQSNKNVLSALQDSISMKNMGTPVLLESNGYYDDDGNYSEFATYGDNYGTSKPFAR